jgi:AraC-like DNA-binding protein
MATHSPKPINLTQNRLSDLLTSNSARLALYRSVLERRVRLARAGHFALKVPHPRGLRLRLAGKPFHATPELFFQEAGRTRFALPSQTTVIVPGAAAIIPAGMPHGEEWMGPFFLNVIVMFQPESFSLHLGYLEAGKGLLRCGPIDRFPSPARFATARYAEEIAQESRGGKDAVLLRQGLYLAILSRLLQGVGAGISPRRVATRGDLLWTRCQEMIDVHFARLDFSVTQLAWELNCSPDHLSRRYRSQTGRRLIEAVHLRRIDHARQLLRESTMNVAEIAWACGFTRPSHFNRIFKRLTGTTPRAFRRHNDETV